MATARQLAGAWGEATLSFLDHLLIISLFVGLPALMAGVAGHNLLTPDPDFLPWLVVRTGIDLLTIPLALAAAMWISREESFFRPGLGEIMGELLANSTRLLIMAVVLVAVVRPSMYILIGAPLAAVALGVLQPVRWLEGGPLWAPRAGNLKVALAAAPLWLGAVGVLFAGMYWDVRSVQDSTPLMLGLDQVVRALIMTWGWAVLMRLYRVQDPEHA